ncbi:MAG: FkbM family methyltransferase [Nanoarchaeota archaeon]|nr:FkbM family methyltransferase [Nanoarchaeota archaeon]MBU1005766.1 FkbM family methyltransferase [Nanoarchaeota archaeon]MBU1946637.1 FkbM family methyltransferase [Nanoarchaeota archaeon]
MKSVVYRKAKTFVRELNESGLVPALKLAFGFFRFLYYRTYPFYRRFVLRTVQGSKMYLDMEDAGVSQTLIKRGIREGLHTFLIKKELKPGDCVLDIGANIGYYALIEASIVGAEGKVYAIEPETSNFSLLLRNIKVNNFSGIIDAFNIAASDKNGFSKFYITKASNSHTMLPGSVHKIVRHATVRTTKIDSFLEGKRKVDLIRMDIEGYECEVIDGAMKTLESADYPLKLIIEIHPPYYNKKNNFGSRLENLFKAGFRIKYLVSLDEPKARKIRDLGYSPSRVMRADGFFRGVYENVSELDAVKLVCHVPQEVRYVFLEK